VFEIENHTKEYGKGKSDTGDNDGRRAYSVAERAFSGAGVRDTG